MKKLAAAVVLIAGLARFSAASEIVLNSSSVVNSVIAPTQNFVLDLNANRVDSLSVQVNYSSANASTVSFTDGQTSTGSITIVSLTGLSTAYATNKITVASNAAGTKASAHVTIISTTGLTGESLTITQGNTSHSFTSGAGWASAGLTTTQAAASLAALIQGSSSYLLMTATNVANVIYATATSVGITPNTSWLLSSSDTSLMTASATFAGGLEKANYHQTITVVTDSGTAVLTEGTQWSQSDVSSNTAVSICSALNNVFSPGIFTSTTGAGGAVVYSSASFTGSSPNAWTVTSSTVALTVGKPTFSGGWNNATIKIGGRSIAANRDFAIGGSAQATATNLKNYLSTSVFANFVSFSTNTGNAVITATSTVTGKWTNFKLESSTPAVMSVSGPYFARGANSDVIYSARQVDNYAQFAPIGIIVPQQSTAALSSIQKTYTSWGVALPVRVAATAGSLPTGLTATVTYYVSNPTGGGFQLANTSTGAVAGLSVSLTTSSLAGGGSFTVTPIALAGTPSFKLQVSDDGTNFSDLWISTNPLSQIFTSSTTFASPYVATNVLWDLKDVTYKVLRMVYTASTWGGTNFNWIVNAKKK